MIVKIVVEVGFEVFCDEIDWEVFDDEVRMEFEEVFGLSYMIMVDFNVLEWKFMILECN